MVPRGIGLEREWGGGRVEWVKLNIGGGGMDQTLYWLASNSEREGEWAKVYMGGDARNSILGGRGMGETPYW